MARLKDLTGMRFGRLVVLERAENINNKTMWLCQCDCGNKKTIEAHSLKIGETRSCGCLQREIQGNLARRHGMTSHPLYKKYRRMVERCENPNCKSYKDYGGRGIKICPEWRNDFMKFYHWAIQAGYDGTKSIDRIDNDGDYSPENCRWATKLEQDNNRRTNRFLDYNGESHTMAEWGRITGIGQSLIRSRIENLGWSVEKALTTPVRGGAV